MIRKTITVSVALPGDKDLSEKPKNEPKAIKPKISWSKLIAEALQNSPNEMLPLPEIYKAISAKHPYYKIGDPSFKSSIRSELTREKNMDMEKGFWKVKGDKGQLISECPFIVLNLPKNNIFFYKFLPKNLKRGQINRIKTLSCNII